MKNTYTMIGKILIVAIPIMLASPYTYSCKTGVFDNTQDCKSYTCPSIYKQKCYGGSTTGCYGYCGCSE